MADSLRIVHLSNAYCFDGTGHTNSTLDLAVAQAALGYSVTMVCRDTDAAMRNFAFEHGLRLVEGIGARNLADVLRSAARLRRIVRTVDLIHLHTVRSVALLALSSPLMLLRRSVSTLHNPHQASTVALYAARRVVAMSRAHAAKVRRRTLTLCRPVVVQNGTLGTRRRPPISEVEPRRLAGRPVVFVGALHRRKGLDILLHAMVPVLRAMPDARLYVIGNRDAPYFEELSERLGLRSVVTFVGYVADPREYMKAADLFVLPSREEGFGNVLTEARECGVPIVASAVGGIPEALDGGRAGDLVAAEDPELLGGAIVRVLGEPDYASDLIRRGQENLERMRVDRAAAEYDRVYRSVAGRSAEALHPGAGGLEVAPTRD